MISIVSISDSFRKQTAWLIDQLLRIQALFICIRVVNERKLAEMMSVECHLVFVQTLCRKLSQVDAECEDCALQLKLLLSDNGFLSQFLSFLSRH